MIPALALLAAVVPSALAVIKGVDPKHPPHQVAASEGQVGYNDCGTKASKSSKCQTAWFQGINDFCLWAPQNPGQALGAVEEKVVAYCLAGTHGTRLLPKGSITGATVIKTKHYIQIKGYLSDQTELNMKKGDYGGELDPHGATQMGNPVGGLVFANDPNDGNKLTQVTEWISFIGNNQFCFRACYNSGPHPFQSCMHIYDTMGCDWVMPDKTPHGVFQQCKGEPNRPPGIFTHADGSQSTWSQGVKPTPSAFPPAATSQCVTQKLTYATYPAKKGGNKNKEAGDESDAPASQPTPASSPKKHDGAAPTAHSNTDAPSSKKPKATPTGPKKHGATPTGHSKMAKAVREGAAEDL